MSSPDLEELLGPSPDLEELLGPSPDLEELLAPSPNKDLEELLGPSPNIDFGNTPRLSPHIKLLLQKKRDDIITTPELNVLMAAREKWHRVNNRSRSPPKTRKKSVSPKASNFFGNYFKVSKHGTSAKNNRSRSPPKTRKKSVSPKASNFFGNYFKVSKHGTSAKAKKDKPKQFLRWTGSPYDPYKLPESMSANRVAQEQAQILLEEYVEGIPPMRKVAEAMQSGETEGKLKILQNRLNNLRSGTGKGIRRQRKSRRPYRRPYRRSSRRPYSRPYRRSSRRPYRRPYSRPYSRPYRRR